LLGHGLVTFVLDRSDVLKGSLCTGLKEEEIERMKEWIGDVYHWRKVWEAFDVEEEEVEELYSGVVTSQVLCGEELEERRGKRVEGEKDRGEVWQGLEKACDEWWFKVTGEDVKRMERRMERIEEKEEGRRLKRFGREYGEGKWIERMKIS